MIKPFEEAHIEALGLDTEHRVLLVANLETVRALSASGHGGSIVASDGTVVGVYGAGPIDPAKMDEAEVFLFLNPKAAQRYAGTLVKDLRHELHRARSRYTAVRAVSADAPLFFRWFSRLGFKFSGIGPRGLTWA